MLNNDTILLLIAHSLVKHTPLPNAIAHCPKLVRQYLVDCLAGATIGVSLSANYGDLGPNDGIMRASLDLYIFHQTLDEDLEEAVETALEIAGVETEPAPGSALAIAQNNLNRFSGLDIDE